MRTVYGGLAAGRLALAGAAAAAADRIIMVSDLSVREAPPGASGFAAHMRIDGRCDRARQLVGAECAAFGKVMVHRTVVESGVGKMVRAPAVEEPVHGSIVFRPGGYHVPLMRPKRTLRGGERAAIMLRFDDGERMPVMRPVRRAFPAAGDMQHRHWRRVSGFTPRWRIFSADKAGRHG